MCEEKKLEYISITDHNTCKQYNDSALLNKNIFSGKIIRGVELHAVFENKNIEVIGYNIDVKVIENWSQKYYSDKKIEEQKDIRYKRLLNICDKHGIIYNESNIEKPTSSADVERPIYEEIIKYEANRDILGDMASSFVAFYRKGLADPNSSYFMNHGEFKPPYKEVVDIIHKAGGKAFLAHPYEYGFRDTINFIDNLRKERELDGIECFHPSSEDENKSNLLIQYAKYNHLYISGGSDYHGSLKPDVEIGVGRGSINISKDYIQEWLE